MADPSLSDLPENLKPLEHDDQVLDQVQTLPQASQKVALDLDDAPFLQDESSDEQAKPPREQEAPAASSVTSVDDEPKEEVRSSKKTIFLLGGTILLILVGVLVFQLIKPTAPPEPALPQDLSHEEAPPLAAPAVQEHFVDLEPFWIAYAQNSDILFLTMKMSLIMEDPNLPLEIQRKLIILRDAVYYYLNNRPLPSVKRIEAAEVLKQDLLSVLNQHLSRPLTGVLIEEYLVQ
ncbi:MAG TPA: flagellar basal body-associated FliL family protein [Desulfonatronum sp.]|nr:flagellar basal body-associated FliL family protein [Desulfonatronum sp.]